MVMKREADTKPIKKIAIFQSDFHVGGIQRSLVNLLKKLEKEDILVDVFLFDDKNIFFPLDFGENITLHFCRKLPYWNRFLYFPLVRFLWGRRFENMEEEYDAAIDFNSYWNECALGAICVKAKKRIMWIHNDVEIKAANEYKYRILWHFFKGKLKYYDEFVPVSAGIQPSFEKRSKITNRPYRVIANTIDTDEIRKKQLEEPSADFLQRLDENKVNVISVGRLCHQKGYDLLLDVVAQVVKRRKDIHFYIAGDGPDREMLEKQIADRKLQPYMTLLGNLTNPFPVMKRMDAFCMMSRYEGQSVAFWEAVAVGLPVVIPKRLEKYSAGIPGTDNVTDALCALQKHRTEFNSLDEYNSRILNEFHKMLEY